MTKQNPNSEKRTKNYLNQVKGAFLYRGVGTLLSLLTLPLVLNYLGTEKFGVWSTLVTIVSWVVFFDLGLGNGLRNKLAESLAINDNRAAAAYISSGYMLIGIMSASLLIIAILVSPILNWQLIFNTNAIPENELLLAVQTTILFVTFNFWLGIINSILGALQKTAISSLGIFISSLLTFLLIFSLIHITKIPSLLSIAFIYGLATFASSVVLTLWFFSKNKDLRPFLYFDKKHISPLLSLGLKFFIIQLTVLVIFTTDKILITQIFGPDEVTNYDVVFRLFSLISMGHALMNSPLWSSYTEAFNKQDFSWIRMMLREQLRLFLLVIIAVFLMSLACKPIIKFWLNENLEIKTSLIVAIAFFVIISTWNNIFSMIANGIGRLKYQFYAAVFGMVVNIPLAIIFTKYLNFGVEGVVYATCLSLLGGSFAVSYQIAKIIEIKY